MKREVHRGAAFAWAIIHLILAAIFLTGSALVFRDADGWWGYVKAAILFAGLVWQINKVSNLKRQSLLGWEEVA